MSSSILLSADEKIIAITGPAGQLEAVLTTPIVTPIKYIGIVCHPHPLHGGTMNNKVVHTVVKTFRDLGLNTIRFNYRGVGNSAGSFDNGVGETADVLAVIEYAKQNFPDHEICLAGFSFGAYVSLRAATQTPLDLLISIAPPVTHNDMNNLIPACPWIIVHGDKDELFNINAVIDWVATLTPNPELIRIADASHFFHGKLIELRSELTKIINKYL
jgi:alpha/beta superfamily hydrolase